MMDRAARRRIEKLEKKYPEEIKQYTELIIQGEREESIKSVKRLMHIEKDRIFKVLRGNRIGKERAEKIILELLESE